MTSNAVSEPVAPPSLQVPFFRPDLRAAEIAEVIAVLESGWLTTGPRVRRFETMFSEATGAPYAVAVNSCTAALHLAVEAVGLKAGEAVLVPTMTFAATAEVVRYLGGIPILVDCDPVTGNMDLVDAAHRIARNLQQDEPLRIVGIMPVHVGGLLMDIGAVKQFAAANDLWIVEDAAHALPAAYRPDGGSPWQWCGNGTADVTCFSFYANKTITTGEGGMAVTSDPELADRMRLMSLHGLSHDAWGRYTGSGKWDYDIVAPGFKYNLTDVAAAIGLHQLARAHDMRVSREAVAEQYRQRLADLEELRLPQPVEDRVHAWHLFPIRLQLDRLAITRDQFIDALKTAGITTAVHWKPLHMHPYYQALFGASKDSYPAATERFAHSVSLPLFPTMTTQEVDWVCTAIRQLVDRYRR